MMKNLPNILTIFRVLSAPIVAIWLVADPASWFPFIIFVTAAFTDFFDGWVARKYNVISPFGKMLDPIADKAMIICVLSAVATTSLGGSLYFIIPAVFILLRETLVSGLREYLGDVKLDVTKLAKWKTTIQLIAVSGCLLSQVHPSALLVHATIIVLIFAAILTIITGVDYFRKAKPYLQG